MADFTNPPYPTDTAAELRAAGRGAELYPAGWEDEPAETCEHGQSEIHGYDLTLRSGRTTRAICRGPNRTWLPPRPPAPCREGCGEPAETPDGRCPICAGIEDPS